VVRDYAYEARITIAEMAGAGTPTALRGGHEAMSANDSTAKKSIVNKLTDNEEYDYKHKVALATVGGPVVFEASVNYPTPSGTTERSSVSRLLDKLGADVGATTEGVGGEAKPLEAVGPEECAKLADSPCWPCYRDNLEHVDASEKRIMGLDISSPTVQRELWINDDGGA